MASKSPTSVNLDPKAKAALALLTGVFPLEGATIIRGLIQQAADSLPSLINLYAKNIAEVMVWEIIQKDEKWGTIRVSQFDRPEYRTIIERCLTFTEEDVDTYLATKWRLRRFEPQSHSNIYAAVESQRHDGYFPEIQFPVIAKKDLNRCNKTNDSTEWKRLLARAVFISLNATKANALHTHFIFSEKESPELLAGKSSLKKSSALTPERARILREKDILEELCERLEERRKDEKVETSSNKPTRQPKGPAKKKPKSKSVRVRTTKVKSSKAKPAKSKRGKR